MPSYPILVVTRPAPKGESFARSVLDGLAPAPRVIYSPAFRVDPLPANVPPGDVIFTSATAVHFGPLGQGVAWCVGDETARAALMRGWDARSARGDAEALIALILRQRPTGPLTHLAGAHRRGDIAERLTAAGLPCRAMELYRQVPLDPTEDLREAARDTVPLVAPVFSPRSVQALVLPGRRAPLTVVAISEAVARAAKRLTPQRLLTAPRPDAVHMTTTTKSALSDLQKP